ncbi:MAG: OmpH family outer membrane protein [Gammaproteobacteria bacterium]
MNKLTFALLSLAAMVSTSAVQAADLNIGFVNVQKLLAEAPQAKSSMQALQDEFAPRLRGLKDQETEFKSQAEKMQRDAAVMGDGERREAERTLRDKQRDLVRRQEEFAEDFNLRRNEVLGQLQKSLMEEVQTFGRNQRYDIIIGDGVLFASDAVDVTAQILSALASRHNSSN